MSGQTRKHKVCVPAFSRALTDVAWERTKQNRYRDAGRFEYTAADDTTDFHKLAMLVEEVGEVSRELQKERVECQDLYMELIQVAAIALAWCEWINRETMLPPDGSEEPDAPRSSQ